MYEPTTGRFSTLDPFFGNLNDPQSLNKYAYVHGDPVNGIDPTGQFMGLIGGGLGLMLGSFASMNMRAKYDPATLSAGVGVMSKIAFWALRYGGAIGAVGGYFLTALTAQAEDQASSLWKGPGKLPERGDNVPVQDWIDSVAQILKDHVDAQDGLTPQQITDGRLAAERLAKGYVLAVQRRAISVFKIEGATNVMFGKDGSTANWLGNWMGFFLGENRDCEHWAMDMYNSMNQNGVTGGWKLRGHFGTLKAGDFSLGWLFKHNFVSLTFDPNGNGSDPAFILDPWARARPDIYEFERFNQLWPIDSETVPEDGAWEPIGG